MTFDQKLKSYFSNPSIRLKDAPAKHLLHLYADYVEIISVFSNGNWVSESDILDRLIDEGFLNKNEEDNDADRAGKSDENQVFVQDVFLILNDRRNLYGTDYPFTFRAHDKMRLNDNLDDRNKLYLILLFSSALNIFKVFQPELTTEFEMISHEALKNFLPKHGIVKSFGKKSEYSGTAREKIIRLANDLNITIDYEAFDEISQRGNQEKGLDLIGWVPFNDQVANLITILCQCACGKEWNKKLNETERYENYFKFHRKKPIHSIFIPYSIVNYQKKKFYHNDEFTDRLLFERNRILQLIGDTTFFAGLESKVFIEKCIKYEEDVV